MDDVDVSEILMGLHSTEAEEAWERFLSSCSSTVLRVIRYQERDADDVSDCFVFVCERLREQKFRRLKSFRLTRSVQFEAWLRVVVRRLCIDWHRTRFGRRSRFQSIARMPVLEQEVYRVVHEQGMNVESAFLLLRPRFPALSKEQVLHALERVREALTGRHLWLLDTYRKRTHTDRDPRNIDATLARDPRPGPEDLVTERETRKLLEKAIASLDDRDRLLVRLRFEEGLTLSQLARVADLRGPQQADRRLRRILTLLRERMS